MEYLEFVYSGKGNISRIFDVCRTFYRIEKQDWSLTDYKKTYEDLLRRIFSVGSPLADLLSRISVQLSSNQGAPVIMVECPRAGVRVTEKSHRKIFSARGCSYDGCGSRETLRRL